MSVSDALGDFIKQLFVGFRLTTNFRTSNEHENFTGMFLVQIKKSKQEKKVWTVNYLANVCPTVLQLLIATPFLWFSIPRKLMKIVPRVILRNITRGEAKNGK